MTSIEQDGCVTFRFYRPGVSNVKVLGTFNEWSGDSLRMAASVVNGVDGWWTVCAELPAGEYRFRYQADGEWFSDYASHGVEKSKHGWNSVLLIPEIVASPIQIMPEQMSEAA